MELINLARGILQLVGIVVVIVCTLALYKVRAAGVECFVKSGDGETISTGLYGNCTWLEKTYRPLLATDENTQWNTPQS